MESINFRVDSSLGEMEVSLKGDAWALIQMCDPSPEIPMVEEIIRSEADLVQAFITIGVPSDEASELAEELWDELGPEERGQREAFQLPGETAN